MNGGAWLDLDGQRVDVLLRDLATVEYWANEAVEGRSTSTAYRGTSLASRRRAWSPRRVPVGSFCGTLGIGAEFPQRLAEHAPIRWRMNCDFSLYHAEMHAARGNAVVTLGQVARAVLEEAQAGAARRARGCSTKST